MDQRNVIIVVLLSVIVTLFSFWFYLIKPAEIISSNERKYIPEGMNISVDIPGDYIVINSKNSGNFSYSFELYENTEPNRLLLSGQSVGELPVSISCTAFQNPEDFSLEEWTSTDLFKTTFFVQDINFVESDYIPEVSDYEYFSDGLYATKNVVFKDSQDNLFNCRVTYITLEDQILKDFEKLLSSIKFLNNF